MTREEAIEWLISRKEHYELDDDCQELALALDMATKALSVEPLTDRERIIFLSAMSMEEKVCREVDAEHPSENYEDTLLFACRSIIKKVKGVLWN